MNHLTDEQLEDVLLTGHAETGHLDGCPQCRARLAEKQAIGNRLRAAFADVHAPAGLADRIRAVLPSRDEPRNTEAGRVLPVPWPKWATWVGVAAVLAIGAGLLFRFGLPAFETEAQAQLIQVHQANQEPNSGVFLDSDPARLANHLRSRLGVAPQPPHTGDGITLRGCCVRTFCRTPVGSYILNTPAGMVSIIGIRTSPQSVGLQKTSHCAGCGRDCACWKKSLGKVNLAAIQREEFAYYAVGTGSAEQLTAVLMAAYPPEK